MYKRQIFNYGTIKLCDEEVRVLRCADWDIIGNVIGSDDQPCRMDARVAYRTFDFLRKIFGKTEKELKADWPGDDFSKIQDLLKASEQQNLEGEVIQLAQKVEGTVRNTGIHAAGLIIAPDDITNYIPVSTCLLYTSPSPRD